MIACSPEGEVSERYGSDDWPNFCGFCPVAVGAELGVVVTGDAAGVTAATGVVRLADEETRCRVRLCGTSNVVVRTVLLWLP